MYMNRVFVGADSAAYFRLLYVEMLILHLDTDYLRAERTWKLLNLFLYQQLLQSHSITWLLYHM